MSRVISPVTGKPYSLATVCRIWQLARSGVYRHLSAPAATAQRRGPLGAMSDEALTTAIRGVLAASPFHGEGHRKVWAPGFTHQRSEVERYAKSGNFRASLALRNVPVSKPRRVVVGRAPLPERLDA